MVFINKQELTSGYKDRMRRLALIDPLNELDRRRFTDLNDKPIDMRGFGMLTLLFFFERRLSREYKTGVQDLTTFLLDMTGRTYHMDRPTMEKIARTLITTFRPSTGKKRTYSFFNWETHSEDAIEYSILKDNDFDAKTQTQYYTLDEDGLELLFATKEFYSEFQISINQLLLKQQIKKGQFHSALRQIREMEIDVDTLREKMEKMRVEILRTIVSEETFTRYKKLLEETNDRLEIEDEEFKALQQFIQETRDMIYSGNIKEKEEKSYQLIIQISKELEAVHYDHARLIELTVDLRTTALATAQESLYYTGIQSFNFDKDIVSTILAKPLSQDIMKGIVHPFLKVEQNPTWSPLTVMAEQPIVAEQSEREAVAFVDIADDSHEHTYQKWIAEKYLTLMEVFVNAYENGKANTLKEFMDYLQVENPSIIRKRYFYSFWLLLHHHSPLTGDGLANHEGEAVLQGVFRVIGKKKFAIEELPDLLRYDDKYSIQNMRLMLEEESDEIH